MCHNSLEPAKSVDYLDICFKSATIFIALFNAYFAFKIFTIKNERDDNERERDRKIQLLKTLILDHNFKYFYELFDNISNELSVLQNPGLTDLQKQEVNTRVGDLFIALRRKFYDSLLAIDSTLYDDIKNKADKFQDEISNTIFDAGINLSHIPKYDEKITEKLATTKASIIKKLFAYRG